MTKKPTGTTIHDACRTRRDTGASAVRLQDAPGHAPRRGPSSAIGRPKACGTRAGPARPAGVAESRAGAQLASTSSSVRRMSSMAPQLTGGTKAADEGWPWLFWIVLPKSKFEKGATSKSAVDVAIVLPALFAS